MTIGRAWCADEELAIPPILSQSMTELCEPTDGIGAIPLATDAQDPTRVRDITNVIYHPCWWRFTELPEDWNSILLVAAAFSDEEMEVCFL
jgi:hypothetical protein